MILGLIYRTLTFPNLVFLLGNFMKEYFERYNFEVNETKWQDTWNKINALNNFKKTKVLKNIENSLEIWFKKNNLIYQKKKILFMLAFIGYEVEPSITSHIFFKMYSLYLQRIHLFYYHNVFLYDNVVDTLFFLYFLVVL